MTRLADSLEAASRVDDPFFGEDQTGTVGVLLRPDGLFDRLYFNRPWRAALTVDSFDQAVLEAITNAVWARIGWTFRDADEPRPPVAASSAAPPSTGVGPSIPSEEIDEALRQANLLLAEFTEALDTAQQTDFAGFEAVEVRSDTGRVVLTMTAGMVSGVASHVGWLRSADESRIIEEFATALESANEVIQASVAGETEPADPALRRAGQAVQELEALVRRFGFPI
ncbi:hypothetical protein [Thermomonospora amylolytica]|uniref:hypothetical protein n=1 Tax=Thermomonospora amylolytica TaxID=1411117 RepID=UPI000E6C2844|nr:hypothetical protein [Thermomonospora amylolytica]